MFIYELIVHICAKYANLLGRSMSNSGAISIENAVPSLHFFMAEGFPE
jgi:hypothetical protein